MSAQRVLRNTVWLIAARIFRLIVGVVLTPFMVQQLGLEQFGLWALVASTVRYLSLADLGIGVGLVKYVAEYAEKGDRVLIRRVVSLGLAAYGVLFIVVMPVAFGITPAIVDRLLISVELRSTAVQLFLLMVVCFFLTSVVEVVSAVLNGLERMHVIASIDVISQIAFVISVVWGLLNGYGILGLITATFAQIIITCVLVFVATWSTFGSCFGNPFALERVFVRHLFSFGGWVQVNNVANLINIELDRFIIGLFVSVSTITYYEIGNRLALLTRFVPLSLLNALLPGAASLDARGNRDRLVAMYLNGTRVLSLLTLAIAGFVAGAADPILVAWMGAPYPDVPLVLGLLIVAYGVHNLTGVGTTILRGIGQQRFETWYSVAGALLNLVLTIALVRPFGLTGVLIGTAVGSAVGSVYFLWLFHRWLNLSFWFYLGRWMWRLLLATFSAALLMHIAVAGLPVSFENERVGSIIVAGGAGLAYVALLVTGLNFLGFFQQTDLEFARGLVPARFRDQQA